MLRRLKSEVLDQLPQKRRQQVFLGIIDKHKRIIGDINKKIKEHKKMVHVARSDDAAKVHNSSILFLLPLIGHLILAYQDWRGTFFFGPCRQHDSRRGGSSKSSTTTLVQRSFLL